MVGPPRYAQRKDANQDEIVRALKAAGASVWVLHEPFDLLVGWQGRNYVLEVKGPKGPRGGVGHHVLTAKQTQTLFMWKGRIDIVRSAADALRVVMNIGGPGHNRPRHDKEVDIP